MYLGEDVVEGDQMQSVAKELQVFPNTLQIIICIDPASSGEHTLSSITYVLCKHFTDRTELSYKPRKTTGSCLLTRYL